MQKIKTRQQLPLRSALFHKAMICCTFGAWYPIYAAKRRKRTSVTYVPKGGVNVNTGKN